MVAGNDGMMSTVDNVAPWTMTVGAFGMDRQFRTPVALGNGVNMFVSPCPYITKRRWCFINGFTVLITTIPLHSSQGISPNTFKLEKMYPLMPSKNIKSCPL